MNILNRFKKKSFDRRSFFRLSAGVVFGLLLFKTIKESKIFFSSRKKMLVQPACTGCMGCVASCPTQAITIAPEGILITDKKCILCGYCTTVCPVKGIKINREYC